MLFVSKRYKITDITLDIQYPNISPQSKAGPAENDTKVKKNN